MKHNWNEAQEKVDAGVLAGNISSSTSDVSRYLGIPYETVRDAVTRGDLSLNVEVETLVTETNQHFVMVPADDYTEARTMLDGMGYDKEQWIVDRVNVGVFKEHTSHRFTLRSKGITPKYPVLRPVEVNLGSTERKLAEKLDPDLAVILPDLHFGFIDDEPIHNVEAIEAALDYIHAHMPRRIVLTGDLLDFTEWSTKFMVKPEHVNQTQKALNHLNIFLATLRKLAPDAIIDALEGNHDVRFANYLMQKVPQAFQLKTTEGHSITQVSTYVNFRENNIGWIAGYPDNETNVFSPFIKRPVRAIHGHRVGQPPGKSAELHSLPDTSTVFGHIHRAELIWHEGANFTKYFSMSPGTLCRIDGVVPGSKKRNNWMNGIGVLRNYGHFVSPHIAYFGSDGVFR